MYQYEAVLQKTNEIVAKDHNIEGLEHKIKSYVRNEGSHVHENVKIIHNLRSNLEGKSVPKIVRIDSLEKYRD